MNGQQGFEMDPDIQILQLQCINDSKDREIAALKAQLSSWGAFGPEGLEEEVDRLRKQVMAQHATPTTTVASPTNYASGGDAAEILEACQKMCLALKQQIQQAQHQIGLASRPTGPAAQVQQPAAGAQAEPSGMGVVLQPAVVKSAEVQSSQLPPPSQQQHPIQSQHPSVLPPQPPSPRPSLLPPHPSLQQRSSLCALAESAGLYDVVEVELVDAQVQHVVRGALLLGGPQSSLHRAFSRASHTASASAPSPMKAPSSIEPQPSPHQALPLSINSTSGRIFVPFRPHIFQALCHFMSEVWGFYAPGVARSSSRSQQQAGTSLSTGTPEEQQQKHCLEASELSLCQEALHAAVSMPCDQAYMLQLAKQLGIFDLVDRNQAKAPTWDWLYHQQQQIHHHHKTPPVGSMNMYAWMQRLQEADR